MAITINSKRCPQNHPCPALRSCPAGALKQNGFRAPEIDAAKCIACEKCIAICPMGAFVEE